VARPAASGTRRSATPAAAATLAGWLRDRDDEQLAQLLRRRPDLGLPAPADFATLASRVGVRTSVQRAVDGLDAWRLRVLEALVLSIDDGQVRIATAIELLPAVDLTPALDDLRAVALIWGPDSRLHLVPGVRDALGSYPAGLGRPADELIRSVPDISLAPVLRFAELPPATQPAAGGAVVARLTGPGLDRLLAAADPGEREVLDRLAGGPPVGLVRDAQAPADMADPSAAKRLLARGLLLPVDGRTVELPREVGIALRGPHPLGRIDVQPPDVDLVPRTPAEADRDGSSAVLSVLRLVAALADYWSGQPAAMLRAGGIGVRELRRTARALNTDEGHAALLIEVSAAAGLIGPTNGIDPSYLPTSDFDGWQRRDPAQRWLALAAAWLAMPRQPSLVGQRDEREKVLTALSPDTERGTVPALRRATLTALSSLPPGAAPATRAGVLARLDWSAPRRSSAQRLLAAELLSEADELGVTASGGLTGYGRALLAGAPSAAADALTIALPAPVDHFLVQPDLTVVVPGPPLPELARELELAADLESTGGASVYRITEASLRRALDAGRTGADLSTLFGTRSRTPVPQGLRYLLDDVARQHGVLRSGAASSYLRCDDESLLHRVVSDRATGDLELRLIAPTVVVSSQPVSRVLDVLRSAGYAPAAEAPDGAVVTLTAEAPRAPSRQRSQLVRPSLAGDAEAQVRQLVARVRSGESLSELARKSRPIAQQIPGITSATTLGLLREAIRGGQSVLLGYVDTEGTASQHTIVPISLAGGTLRGHEEASSRLQSFPLHRITTVSVLPAPS
jgi:hypothetical protein